MLTFSAITETLVYPNIVFCLSHLQLKEKTVYILFNLCGGTLGTAATTGLLYQPRMIGDGDWWNGDWQGKQKYSEKTCSSATLSTTNPT
jgi:hypothetical protein